MPPCGTFDYVAVVPDQPSGRLAVRCRTAVERTGDDLRDFRLVGFTPSLEIEDAGLTPNPGFTHGVWRPEVMRSRLLLQAAGRKGAVVATASFYIDRGVVSALRVGDLLHMARTACGGVGLSVLRQGGLVVAFGAVTAVPLGDSVKVRVPSDLLAQAEVVLRSRDPTFEFPELPIEVTIGERTAILLRGCGARIGDYEVMMQHGFYRGIPGVDESLAVVRIGQCSDVAANASAILLGVDGIQLVQW